MKTPGVNAGFWHRETQEVNRYGSSRPIILAESIKRKCDVTFQTRSRARDKKQNLAHVNVFGSNAPNDPVLFLIPQFVLIGRERGCNSDAGTFLIGQEDRQQCMSGPIFTECARTARKRTIGALVLLILFENLEEGLDSNCSALLYPMRRLRKEENLTKTENLDSARTSRWESQWHVVDLHSAAVCCCSRPMVGLFYKAVPVLADEDKIGGSAIARISFVRRVLLSGNWGLKIFA